MKTKRAKPFYKTKVWQMAREAVLARDGFLCQSCLREGRFTGANTVHHVKPLELFPALALSLENLQSVCSICHNKIHGEEHGAGRRSGMVKQQRKARVVICHPNPPEI